jgi:hypothetical protein
LPKADIEELRLVGAVSTCAADLLDWPVLIISFLGRCDVGTHDRNAYGVIMMDDKNPPGRLLVCFALIETRGRAS